MARKKSRLIRVSPEFYDLLKHRTKKFGTTFSEESKNIMCLANNLGTKFGFDPKNIPFTKKPKIKFKNKVMIFK